MKMFLLFWLVIGLTFVLYLLRVSAQNVDIDDERDIFIKSYAIDPLTRMVNLAELKTEGFKVASKVIDIRRKDAAD